MEAFQCTRDERWLLHTLQSVIPESHVRIVGGWVRDHLRGHPTMDLDVVLMDVDPAGFARNLVQSVGGSAHTIKAKPEHARNVQTIKVFLHSPTGVRHEIDICSISIAAHETWQAALRRDALGRDLTANALYYHVQQNSIEDPTAQGLDDVRQSRLRVPEANRSVLWDDPLRLLRIARFHTTLDWEIETETRVLMQDKELHKRLAQVTSPERMGQEILRMWQHSRGFRAMEALYSCGVLDVLLTSATQSGGLDEPLAPWNMDQCNSHHLLNLWQHSLSAMQHMARLCHHVTPERMAILSSAALLHDVGKRLRSLWGQKPNGERTYHGHENQSRRIIEHLCSYLHLGESFLQEASTLVQLHMQPAGLALSGDAAIRRFLRTLHARGGSWRDVLALCRSDILSKGQPEQLVQNILEQLDALTARIAHQEQATAAHGQPIGKPLLSGHEIMRAFHNLQPGPWIGEVQQYLLELQDERGALEAEEAGHLLRQQFPTHIGSHNRKSP